jgi:hypothetical protein
MKLLISSLLFMMSFTQLQASVCDQILLAGSGDSKHITAFTWEVPSNDNEMMDAQMALNASNFMNQKLDCNVVLDDKNSDIICSYILLKNHNICNVKTIYGFYIVYKDYVDTVHITFNRWD